MNFYKASAKIFPILPQEAFIPDFENTAYHINRGRAERFLRGEFARFIERTFGDGELMTIEFTFWNGDEGPLFLEIGRIDKENAMAMLSRMELVGFSWGRIASQEVEIICEIDNLILCD